LATAYVAIKTELIACWFTTVIVGSLVDAVNRY